MSADEIHGPGSASSTGLMDEDSEAVPLDPEIKTPTYVVSVDKERLSERDDIPEVMKEWLALLPDRLEFSEPVILITGENGSGKTTLAKAITQARLAGNGSNGLLLPDEDPAVAVAEILKVEEDDANEKTRATFIEGPEVMSEIRRWANEQYRKNEADRIDTHTNGRYTHRLSNRQLFEQTIADLKQMRIERNRSHAPHVAVIFDEPEQGLSPARQMELPESLIDFIKPGDTMLVPTNNLALYLSDLPRIDLERPERGVHRPSQYGEQATIKFHSQVKT